MVSAGAEIKLLDSLAKSHSLGYPALLINRFQLSSAHNNSCLQA